MAENSRSEDVLGEKWDHCLTDTAIKLGTWVLFKSSNGLCILTTNTLSCL